jgi:hypothetical protein
VITRWPRIAWLTLGGAGLVAAGVLAARSPRGAATAAPVALGEATAQVVGGPGPSQIRPLDDGVARAELPNEHQRKILALYNGLVPEVDAENNLIHQRAELILNHLGLIVELRDVNQPLPGPAAMASYRGVLAWVAGAPLRQPRSYLAWLGEQARAGRRVVLLGGLGAGRDTLGRATPPAELDRALEAIGLRYLGDRTDDPQRIAIERKDPAMVEFERALPRRLELYERYQLVDPARGRSYLTLRRRDRPDAQATSEQVVVTPQGGFVAPGYVYDELRLAKNYVLSWRVNPFRFFAEAFGIEHAPRPDFTTLGGARIYYSHIDGDGFPSISEVDRKSMCGDFTRAEVLERYNLPVTVSFVVAEIKPPPRGLGTPERVRLARRIAALPNVELAVHGLAHPMDWRARDKAICSYDLPGYRMSAEQEIVFASRYIRDVLAPPGKATKVMLWTGWCNPAEDQLALAWKEGLYNLNGGDPVMSGEFPSYMHLAPPIHRVGKLRQYFTSGPNEYILTEEWQPPYHRWRNLIDIFQRTEAPHRVVPMNVYYHFYVVEKPPALAAMHDVMRSVLDRRPAPLFVSEYIDVVRDFETMRLGRLDPASDEGWRVLNSGYARTIRFDRWDRHVDLERSRGVIGYRRAPEQKALYVHLDESHDHTVVLSAIPPTRPYVSYATSYLERVVIGADRISLRTRGIGRKHLAFANLPPGVRYRISARNEAGASDRAKRTSFTSGVLEWSSELNGEQIEVTIEREGAGG